jgi:hypothetical protein
MKRLKRKFFLWLCKHIEKRNETIYTNNVSNCTLIGCLIVINTIDNPVYITNNELYGSKSVTGVQIKVNRKE